MPEHRHLRRLPIVWQRQPVFFITTCTANRPPILANSATHLILREEWAGLTERHGWAVGPYVIMPDHVHFFVSEMPDAKPLSTAIAKWKEWTAKRIFAETGGAPSFWQPEFFAHLLRSTASRAEKWAYVFENPVRAGLAFRGEDWPYRGAIHLQ